jgi:EAL domain-containing protein (putative c-di-GMP-specific phosphodiesterase class I)
VLLEMTETVMFHETSTTLTRLAAIRELGVRIAIDDFGTGYSSLGYLRRFRVDVLKIAREFVGPAERSEDWAFAAAIVALGRTLDLTIVAEGIETAGQLERLRALGCELGQGYLFARPADADATLRFLKDGGSRRPIAAIGTVDRSADVDGDADERPFRVGQASA